MVGKFLWWQPRMFIKKSMEIGINMKKLFLIFYIFAIVYGKNTISKINYDKIFANFYFSSDNKMKEKYLEILGKGARNNNPKALFYSALIFDKILTNATSKKMIKFLYKESIKEFQKRNDKNVVYPLYALGVLYMREKNYSKGTRLLQKSSDLNYYKATRYLIGFYETEFFYFPKSLTKKRIKTIISLYKKLSKSKKYCSFALVGLARWYMTPYSNYSKNFINYDLALKYSLEVANEYQNREAYENLVTLYRYRNTKYKDINKSYYYEALSHIEYLTSLEDDLEGLKSLFKSKKMKKNKKKKVLEIIK